MPQMFGLRKKPLFLKSEHFNAFDNNGILRNFDIFQFKIVKSVKISSSASMCGTVYYKDRESVS